MRWHGTQPKKYVEHIRRRSNENHRNIKRHRNLFNLGRVYFACAGIRMIDTNFLRFLIEQKLQQAQTATAEQKLRLACEITQAQKLIKEERYTQWSKKDLN